MNALDNADPRIRFYALAGVEHLSASEAQVRGAWVKELKPIETKEVGKLAEEFANTRPHAVSILRFTRQCGPVGPNVHPGAKFSFTITEWLEHQIIYRNIWHSLVDLRHDAKLISVQHLIGPSRRDLIVLRPLDEWELPISPGTLTYKRRVLRLRLSSIWHVLLLDLLSVPIERLRVCQRLYCPNLPYFVARTDLKARYCSDLCSAWAQRQHKLTWWNKKGKELRKREHKKHSHERK
jgi:hypothetical protein